MPRISRRHLTPELAIPTGLTAAAHRINPTSQTKTITSGTHGWKTDAWNAYDSVGELRYVCQWISNALSRVTLYAADIDPATGRPTTTATTNKTATEITTDIAGGPAGQAAMLHRLATFLTVPGEGWIAVINRETTNGIVEEWHVLSADEITNRGGKISLTLPDTTHDFNPDTDILTRVYCPHPRNSRESDSPVRAALPVLHEIQRMTAAIEGAAKSRITGNGMLLLPQEISMPVTEPPRADPDAPGLPLAEEPITQERTVTAQDVMVQLQQVMTTAIQDPTSAAALVPIVLKAPGDTLDKIRHLRFESDINETSLKTREAAIRRLAISLDVPPEVLTGVGATNHWSAWSIDEASIKTHIAPMMTVICDALTEAVLHPLLDAAGYPPEQVIWYNLTDLALRPDRGEDAVAAFDRGAINATTLRRELGFTDDDAPSETMSSQEQRQLAIEMLKGAPSLLPYLAEVLGIPISTNPGSLPNNHTKTPESPDVPTMPEDPR